MFEPRTGVRRKVEFQRIFGLSAGPIARRQVLQGLGSVLLCGLTFVRSRQLYEGEGIWVGRQRLIASLLPSVESAGELGVRYLAKYPNEGDRGILWRSIFQRDDSIDELEGRRVLAERILADFQACNVIILGGWVVARSEARLCALRMLE